VGIAGCFGPGDFTDAGGRDLGGGFASGGGGITSCFGTGEFTDVGGSDFDGRPNRTTTA
jgi:hypothetical protein